MDVTGKVKLLCSNTVGLDQLAVAPTVDELDYGQIAVNYNAINPALFFKVYNETSKTDEIVKIVTEEVIADTLIEILGGSAAELSTLKELLEAFGSSDIATTQASILTRLSSVETGKVSVVPGKGLSTNDYTTTEKNKLSGIAAGAQVNTVTSVAGKTGAVTLVPSDCGALAADGTAVAATKATFVGAIPLGNYLGKTVGEVKTAIVKCVETNGSKGTFYIELNTYGESFLNNWDRPTHVLTAGNTLTYIKVTCGANSKYAHLEFTSYSDKYIYTSFINAGNFGALRRVMHTDDTAVAATKLETKRKINGVDFDGTSDIVSNRVYANVIPNETDYNTLTTGGWYHCPGGGAASTMINCPTSITHSLLVTASVNSRVAQVIYDYYGQSYSRFWKGADGWSEWVMMYHTGNINLPTVPLVCNTLTSTFGILIQDDNHFRPLNFVRGDNSGTIGVGDDGSLLLRKGAKGVANADLRIFSDNITYNTNTIYHAGNSNKADVPWTCSALTADNVFLTDNWVRYKKTTGYVSGNQGDTLSAYNVRAKDFNIDATNKSKPTLSLNNYSHSADDAVKAGSVLGEILFRKHAAAQTGASIQMFQGSDNSLYDGGLSFLTNGGSGATTKMTILPNGNVGIGVTNPTERLTLDGNIKCYRGYFRGDIIIQTPTTGGWAIGTEYRNGVNNEVTAGIGAYGAESTQERLSLGCGKDWWTVGLHINKNNNVGINNTIPTERLDVMGNGKFSGKLITNTASIGSGNVFSIDAETRANTTTLELINATWRAGIASTDGSFVILAQGSSAADKVATFNKEVATFEKNGLFKGNVTAQGDVVAYSATSNVRIEPLAGASALFDLTDVELPADLTSANNHVLAYNTTKKKWTAVESAGTNGSAVDYARLSNIPTTFAPCPHNHEDATYISDVRLKQNIEPLNNALNTVLALRAKSFSWTTEAKERYRMKDESSYGYIAQEVEGIIPDIVKELETGDGYIGVEYIKVIPFITEGIRELHKEIYTQNGKLKAELTKMKSLYGTILNKCDSLEKELELLKSK